MGDDRTKHNLDSLPLAFNRSLREKKPLENDENDEKVFDPADANGVENVIPMKPLHKDWTPKERKIFADLYDVRIGYGREALFATGLDENGDPWFCLYVAMSGECIMAITRGDNGIGYYVLGPSRKTAYVRTLEELERGFAQLEEGYKANLLNKKQ